jgi:ribosomal protein S20
MENQALQYIKSMLDKATQKGVYTLDDAANIVSALEKIYLFINQEKPEDHGKEES